jgi:hypothetical protein
MKCKVQKIKAKTVRKSGWIITNNGEIQYPYRVAKVKDITRARFKRALKALVEKGFLDIHHSGMGGLKGDTSKYGISERWRVYGSDKFEPATMEPDTRKGIGFAALWSNPTKREALLKKREKAVIGNDTVTIL